MKLRLPALILVILGFIVSASAFADSDKEQSTEADAAAIRACFGGCENNDNQTNINSSPYEVDKQYKEIMQDRSVVDPSKGRDPGAKRESWDI